MPSPDFSQYVDLTLYDKDPATIYLDAINYAQTVALPEFNPRAGSIEDALLQAIAYATSELGGTINRLPDGLLEGILRLYGFERQQSISARMTIEVTLLDTAGGTIPSGALFSYTIEGEDGLETYFFSTVQDLVIDAGSENGTVEAEALTVGVIPTIDNGTPLTLVSGVSRVLSAVSLAMIQGEDEESDISYFTRAAAFLASRSNSVATSTQMQNFLGSYLQEIQRAYVSDLTFFKYMRVSSVERTGEVVTAQISDMGGSWSEANSVITITPSDITVGTTTVIVRHADDSTADVPINGTSLSGPLYKITYADYDSLTDILTVQFQTDVSTDAAQQYLPSSTAPHHFSEDLSLTPNDPYIEILIHPQDYNEHNGAVGLVFGNSSGLPIQSTPYLNVQQAIAEKSLAGLKFTAISPLLVPVTVTVQVEHAPTYGAVAVRQAVQTALYNYMSPSNWVFGSPIYVNSLIGIAASVTGVARIADLTLSVATGQFSELGTYDLTNNRVDFEYPFCLPVPDITVTGVV